MRMNEGDMLVILLFFRGKWVCLCVCTRGLFFCFLNVDVSFVSVAVGRLVGEGTGGLAVWQSHEEDQIVQVVMCKLWE